MVQEEHILDEPSLHVTVAAFCSWQVAEVGLAQRKVSLHVICILVVLNVVWPCLKKVKNEKYMGYEMESVNS